MSKKIIIICVILLIAILIVLGILSKGKKTFYETDELKKCTISQTVEASGTINPVNTVSVGSTVSGLIKEIYVDFNSVVKKGQVLAQSKQPLSMHRQIWLNFKQTLIIAERHSIVTKTYIKEILYPKAILTKQKALIKLIWHK